MADPNEQYKKALENVENLLKRQKDLNQATDKLKTSWNAIASEIFKLDGAAFFKQVPLSTEDIKRLNSELEEVNRQVKVLGEEFGEALDADEEIKRFTELASASFADLAAKQQKFGEGSKEAYEAELKYLKQIRASRTEFANLSDDDLKTIGEHIAEGGKLSEIYDDLEETSKNIIKANAQNPDILIESEQAARGLHAQTQKIRDELENGTKEAFSLKSGLQAAFQENVIKGGLQSLMTFDDTIHDVQRNTGIMMDSISNSQSFASLTRDVQEFGMSTAQAGEYMKAMSDELDSTNFSVLSQATKDFAAIEGATGASAEDVTTIAGQLMRMGASSGHVKEYMEDAAKMAKSFGVNSKKAMADISKNISKMRNMGFVGGEESLKKMVIQAQKLNMNVDEIFDVADRARTIEGAMEMASQLQLAGGSFANINPMDLLAAARNDPKALQKILTQMGSDIGKFNKETGQIEFDAVDKERLQMVADATGMTVDNLMNGIQKTKIEADKIKPFEGMLGGLKDADKALAQSSLNDMMKWDEKSGKFQIDADNDLAKKMGITSLDQINGDMITEMIQAKKDEEKNLEEQNKANQAFSQALDNFWKSIQSLFNVLQPVLEGLTWVVQTFTSAITGLFKFFDQLGWFGMILKWTVPLLLLFGTSFGASVLTFVSKGVMTLASSVSSMIAGSKSLLNSDTWKNLGKSVVGGMKDAWGTVKDVFTGKFKKAIPVAGEGAGGSPLDSVSKTAGESEKIKPTSGGGLKGFVENLTNMSKEATKIDLKGIGKLALSMIMLAAPIGIMAALFAGVDPMLLLAFGGVLIEQAIALAIMSKFLGAIDIGNVAKGALAMVILGVAMIPFAFAAQMLGGIDWLNVLAGIGILALVMLGLIGIGALLMSPAGLFLAIGVAALIGVGIGLAIFGASMMVFALAAQMLQGLDFTWLSNLGWALLTAAPGLFFGGLALGLATPGLIYGSLGLMAIALAAQVAAAVDWSVIAGMGDALGQAAGGLFLFSLSALMFANPFVLAGIFFMVVAITALAAVMVPLSLSLQLGADSMTKFAIGLERLSAAADTLSDEKLAKLQKISEAMAKASAAGNVAGAMANTAEGAGGGAGGGGGTRKLEIDIKMNGRDVAYVINKDTQIVK